MKMNRRSFIVTSAAVTGGLALGFDPFGRQVVRAADGSPEVNAWVVIRPNDQVVIRVARSEMGQGTITGGSAKSRPTGVSEVRSMNRSGKM